MTEFHSIDTRPLISDLLKDNASVIESVKKILKTEPLYQDNVTRYDDIWILRYVLSHKKKSESAAKAALKTMQFREKYKLNELGDIRYKLPSLDVAYEKVASPAEIKYRKFLHDESYYHVLPDEKKGIVTYIRMAKLDTSGLGANLSEDEIFECYIKLNEPSYQILDHITRSTGRLTKQLKIIDLEGQRLRNFNRAFLKKDAAVSTKIEDFYPQMLGMMAIVNAPSWFIKFYKAVRVFFPKRLIEKVDVLPPKNKVTSNDLARIFKYVAKENFSEKYGGSSTTWPPPHAGLLFQKT